MAQGSKMINNRIGVARSVVSSWNVHGIKAAAAFAERLAQLGISPPVNPLMIGDMFAAMLEKDTELLGKREHAYVQEQGDDPKERVARDAAARPLYTKLVAARSFVETAFGPAEAEAYGFRGETPQGPEALATFTKYVVGLLRARPRIEERLGTIVDTVAVANHIDEALAPLDAALGNVTREERELHGALAERDRQLETWSTTYQTVANTLTGMFRTAGMHELADRVRPTERRATGEQGVDEDVTIEEPTPTPTPTPTPKPEPKPEPVA